MRSGAFLLPQLHHFRLPFVLMYLSVSTDFVNQSRKLWFSTKSLGIVGVIEMIVGLTILTVRRLSSKVGEINSALSAVDISCLGLLGFWRHHAC